MNKMIVFDLDGTDYCLNIKDVNEIIKFSELSKIPESPEFIEGLLNLRGKILSIVNPRILLQLPKKPPTQNSKILIVNHNISYIGLLVDDVNEIIKINETSLESLPPNTDIKQKKYLLHIIKHNGSTIYELNLDALLSVRKEAV